MSTLIEIKTGKLHSNLPLDNYWTRVSLKSPQEDKHTFVFVCASHEYLGDTLKTQNFNENQVKTWVNDVVAEWKSKGDSIFKKPFHLEVRANTAEGYKSGIEFLKNEIVPNASA